MHFKALFSTTFVGNIQIKIKNITTLQLTFLRELISLPGWYFLINFETLLEAVLIDSIGMSHCLHSWTTVWGSSAFFFASFCWAAWSRTCVLFRNGVRCCSEEFRLKWHIDLHHRDDTRALARSYPAQQQWRTYFGRVRRQWQELLVSLINLLVRYHTPDIFAEESFHTRPQKLKLLAKFGNRSFGI